jgi:putative transposase
MKHYNSYHTELKCLARENLLSREISVLIPRSTIHRWRNEQADKYKMFDLNLKGSQDYELMKSFASHKNAKKVFSAYVRLSKFFLELTHSIPKFQLHLRERKFQIVKIIARVKDQLGLANVLRVFNISIHAFRQWRMDTFTECFNSIVNRCTKIYPTQLSRGEVKTLKEKLIDPVYQFWPVSSIAFQSLRDGSLPLSLNTWYKYANRLGVIRPKPTDRRKKRTEGIRANRSNEIWHADITRFVTLDHVTHYVYFVVDNFSRKILSWRVANKVSAVIRRETIGEAVKDLNTRNEHILLITDGGPENSLEEYIQNLSLPITHQRALIDVQFSNSLIEAHNKIIKYNYLYRKEISNSVQLIRELDFAVNDFNNRPHISLGGLTPNESHSGFTINLEPLKKLKVEASLKRKVDNLKNRC